MPADNGNWVDRELQNFSSYLGNTLKIGSKVNLSENENPGTNVRDLYFL